MSSLRFAASSPQLQVQVDVVLRMHEASICIVSQISQTYITQGKVQFQE